MNKQIIAIDGELSAMGDRYGFHRSGPASRGLGPPREPRHAAHPVDPPSKCCINIVSPEPPELKLVPLAEACTAGGKRTIAAGQSNVSYSPQKPPVAAGPRHSDSNDFRSSATRPWTPVGTDLPKPDEFPYLSAFA